MRGSPQRSRKGIVRAVPRTRRSRARERQNGRMIEAGFIEAGDKMRAAGTGGASTHGELAGELGLAGGGQRRAFLMTDTNPFDMASPERVG